MFLHWCCWIIFIEIVIMSINQFLLHFLSIRTKGPKFNFYGVYWLSYSSPNIYRGWFVCEKLNMLRSSLEGLHVLFCNNLLIKWLLKFVWIIKQITSTFDLLVLKIRPKGPFFNNSGYEFFLMIKILAHHFLILFSFVNTYRTCFSHLSLLRCS